MYNPSNSLALNLNIQTTKYYSTALTVQIFLSLSLFKNILMIV